MTLSTPAGLWLLAAGAPLIALFLYRVKPRVVRVPYLPLWMESVAEQRRWGGPRVREVVSLALLLAALAAMSLALAGAEVAALARAPVHYIVLVDESPSMQAVEADSITRAVAAERCIEALRGRLYYNDTLDVRRSPEDRFAPFVASVAADPPAGTLLVLSDRSEPCAELPARWAALATDRGNVGLTHAVVGRAPEERWFSARVRVRNFGAAPATLRADWRLDGASRRSDPLSLAPGEEVELAMTFDDAPRGGELRVVLTPTDAYPLDDDVKLALPDARAVPVAVFHGGKPNAFLMEALAMLREAGEIDADLSFIEPVERFDEIEIGSRVVCVFDGPGRPADRALVLGGGAGAPIESPRVVSWNVAHPINRFLDFSAVHLRAARAVVGDETLVETPEAVVGATWPGRVELGFRLDESDFALSPSFPIFVRNALRWLSDPPVEPVRLDPVESDIAPKAAGEPPDALLPEPPRAWRNVPHAVLFAMLAVVLLVSEWLVRQLGS